MPAILALNAGSSTLKFALFHGETEILRGSVELGDNPSITATTADKKSVKPPNLGGKHYKDVLNTLLGWLHDQLGGERIAAVGHRIVHGGLRFADPVRIDSTVLAELQKLVPLAPLHQPHGLAAISAIQQSQPELVQVACFDTAFHRTMPEVATRLALPRDLGDANLRRFGFHGLSYEFIASRLRALAPTLARGRVIAAHLGNGASLCAMQDGRSVETTMGFSTLDGLVMATRPGNLDPGALLYLMQSCNMTTADLEDLLYHRSGLRGVSGLSGDMRELAASKDPRAAEAIALFTYRIAGEVARLASALGGLDGLVFTGGIGEHDPAIRTRVCEKLAWLGVVAQEAGAPGPCRISTGDSAVEVWIVPTDEEAVIAQHTRTMLEHHPSERSRSVG